MPQIERRTIRETEGAKHIQRFLSLSLLCCFVCIVVVVVVVVFGTISSIRCVCARVLAVLVEADSVVVRLNRLPSNAHVCVFRMCAVHV